MNSSSSSILPIRVAILVDCDNVSPDILGLPMLWQRAWDALFYAGDTAI